MSKLLTEKEQEEKLLSKRGNPVNFEYPEPNYPEKGILKDRCALKTSDDDVVYWDVIDLIEFKNHNEKWLRLSYYRYDKKEPKPMMRYAGQNSLTEPLSTFEKLFIGGIKNREWIREFFKNVFKQCTKELE